MQVVRRTGKDLSLQRQAGETPVGLTRLARNRWRHLPASVDLDAGLVRQKLQADPRIGRMDPCGKVKALAGGRAAQAPVVIPSVGKIRLSCHHIPQPARHAEIETAA